MVKRGVRDKIRYPQPYSININTGNEALDERLIEYLHARAKYNVKYFRSKKSKRNY